MILGDVCTRRCGFCNVKTGKPTWNDPLEPLRVANQVKRMGLRHAVDHLGRPRRPARLRRERLRRRDPLDPACMAPGCKVEVLTPDFRGQEMPLAKVIAERPDVFNHNVETVPRLYPMARRGSRLPALGAGAADGEGDGRRRGRHQVRADGRARRGVRRDGRGLRDPARAPRPGADRRPVPAADREAPAGRSATGTRTSSRRSRRPPTSSASSRSPPGRWSAPRYHADEQLPAAASALTRRTFPCRGVFRGS